MRIAEASCEPGAGPRDDAWPARIYLIGDDRKPVLTPVGAYSAWLELETDCVLYDQPTEPRRALATINQGKHVQLLLPSNNKEGADRVSHGDLEGWIDARKGILLFVKHVPATTPSTTPDNVTGDLKTLQGRWKLVELRWTLADLVSSLAVTEDEELHIIGNELTMKYRAKDGVVEEK